MSDALAQPQDIVSAKIRALAESNELKTEVCFVIEFDHREGNKDKEKKGGYNLDSVIQNLNNYVTERPRAEKDAPTLKVVVRKGVHLPLGDICVKQRVIDEVTGEKNEITIGLFEVKQMQDLINCLKEHDHLSSQIMRLVDQPDELRTGLIMLFKHDALDNRQSSALESILTRAQLRGKPWFSVTYLPFDFKRLAKHIYNICEECCILGRTGKEMLPLHKRLGRQNINTNRSVALTPVDHLFKSIKGIAGIGDFTGRKIAEYYKTMSQFLECLHEENLALRDHFTAEDLGASRGLGERQMEEILKAFGVPIDESKRPNPKKRKDPPKSNPKVKVVKQL